MSLPLETAESPFKNKNSLGQVLVDGNQLDISNINCYLQLLAQTANKKEKLRRKKRRERREKKKGNSSGSSGGGSSKERRRSRREREGKEKEIEPDVVPGGTDTPIKSEPFPTATDEHGLTLAPTLPSHSTQHPNSAMGRRAASSPITPTPADSSFEHSLTHSLVPPTRSSSWSQFIIDHTQQQQQLQQQHDAMSGYMSMSSSPQHMVPINPNHNHYPQSSFLHNRSSPTSALYHNPVGQPSFVHQHHQQQPIFDPAAEFIQFMTEHQSCSNPSFTFSSSFSSDALSPISEENFMGFPAMAPSSRSPFLPQHVSINTGGFGAIPSDLMPSLGAVQMNQPPSGTCYSQDFAGLLTTSTPTSSFGMEPIDDRDGTFASLEFLEAALAQDMRDA